MKRMRLSSQVRGLVRKRAAGRCEYCHFPEAFAELGFQLDHVVALKHGGAHDAANLAFACYRCNSHKGPNLAGLDPTSRRVTRLFNPREDDWQDHFRWSGPRLVGKTAIGRATIGALCCNRMDAVLVRRTLMEEGVEF